MYKLNAKILWFIKIFLEVFFSNFQEAWESSSGIIVDS